jgi:hypothetical protein
VEAFRVFVWVSMEPKNNDVAYQSSALAFRKEVLENWLKRGEEDYKEAERISDLLEGKAEKVSTIAAALIAAGLAFVNPQVGITPIANFIGFYGLGLLALGVILLVCSLAFCVATLWVRKHAAPLSAEAMGTIASDLLASSSSELESRELKEGYLTEQARIWNKSVAGMKRVNQSKARSLRIAQITLAVALLSAALVLLEVIVKIAYQVSGRGT